MTNKNMASKALLTELSKDEPQWSNIDAYLAEGADINYSSEEDGYTALMFAVDRDDEPLVNYLLQHGADPLSQNHYKEIASQLALSHSPIYQLIKNYELLTATAKHELPAVKLALDSGAEINFQGQDGYTALLIAVEEGCFEIVELLMKHGSALSLKCADGSDVFDLAADRMIYKTLEYGAPLTDEQKRKLLEQYSNEEEVMTGNEMASTALCAEIKNDEPQLSKIESYLSEGADINYQLEENGDTPLMLAVEKKNQPLVAFLLEHGANPFLKNHLQQTVSDLVDPSDALYKHLKNHELLLATLWEDSEKVRDALAKGADINFQGKGGYTAMMIAAENNSLKMVELLITYKPNFYRKTEDGLTVYDFVHERLIHKTLQVYRPLTFEEKDEFFKSINIPQRKNEDCYELGRLKMLADRKGKKFHLSQLQFNFIESPATEEEINELQKYIAHPLPELYKEICRHYNGGAPKLNYYDDEDGGWNTNNIGCFFHVTSNRAKDFNIWNAIEDFSPELKKDCLPFAGDNYGDSIFYLKWVGDKVQVWRLLYGELAYEYDDDNNEHGRVHVLINESFDDFLESLYAVEK